MLILALSAGTSLYAQNSGKGKFTVHDHYRDGDAYTIEYFAPFPGMTKVKLFDEQGELLWRSQYLDPEGENKVRLRANYLEPGLPYVFQLEYKLETVRLSVAL